jgi:hypothetical protein
VWKFINSFFSTAFLCKSGKNPYKKKKEREALSMQQDCFREALLTLWIV